MKSRKIFFSIILSITILLFFYKLGVSGASDLDVCPTCTYTTIQSAINAANSGDRVVVGTPGRTTPESYNENIIMKDGVDVVSEGDDSGTTYTDPWGTYSTPALKRATLTIINGNGINVVVEFPETISTNVTLDGFTIQNIDETASDNTFLIDIKDNSPTIKNCIVRDNLANYCNGGIYIESESAIISPIIESNIIHYTKGPGICSGNNSAAIITDNEIFTSFNSGYSVGIGLKLATSPTISNNNIFDNGNAGIGSQAFGVDSTGSPIIIKGNTIHHNSKAGINIKGNTSGIQVEIGGGSVSEGNQIYNNSLAGIKVEGTSSDIYSVNIENNNIDNNFVGMRLDYISSLSIKKNTISNSTTTCGITLISSSGAPDVTIQENDIYGNSGCGVNIYTGSPVLDINDNDIYSNGWAGIRLYGNPSGIITQNRIYQNSYGGIGIQSQCTLEISKNETCYNVLGGIHTGRDLLNGGGFINDPGTANLTIKQNKVHNNGMSGYGGGIDVRHASGIIHNNLVYKNHRGGIRFGDWIYEIINNTVVANGKYGNGGGIIYDALAGAVNDPPSGNPQSAIPIRNNISTHNETAGIRAGLCTTERDYNLLYDNRQDYGGYTDCSWTGWPGCKRRQLGGCGQNAYEIFADPLFLDMGNDDYRLQTGSPAIDAGDSDYGTDVIPPGKGTPIIDMGAFGGPDGIDW